MASVVAPAERQGTDASQVPLAEHPLLQDIEILAIREGGKIECMVPVWLIDNEEVPVKKEWVSSLASQMKALAEKEGGGSGQDTAITLGLIDGETTLKIMDGYHRSAALRLNGEAYVYATIKHTDWESLYDYRILMSKDHPQVRFSRVVQWMVEAWQHSGLADKLTIEQAVLQYRYDLNGLKLGLDPDVVAAAKAWIARKEAIWEIEAMTIHSYLKVAQSVDPALVHSARPKVKGRPLEAPTQSILKVFSSTLPNQFELQNLVMDTAKSAPRLLETAEVRALCKLVKNCKNITEAQALMGTVDWEALQPEYQKTRKQDLRRAHDPRYKGGKVLDLSAREVEMTIERAELSMDRGEEVTPAMRAKVMEARTRATKLQTELGNLVRKLSELVGEPAPEEISTAVGQAATQAAQSPIKPAKTDHTKPSLEPKVESEQTGTDAISDLPEPDADTINEDFDPEDELDDERVTLQEDEEDDTPTTDEEKTDFVGFDEDPEENNYYEEENEQGGEEELEPLHSPRSPAFIAAQASITRESAAASRFNDALRMFLNGQAEDPPHIANRIDAARAERVLLEGRFSADPYFQEEIREMIANIRRSA